MYINDRHPGVRARAVIGARWFPSKDSTEDVFDGKQSMTFNVIVARKMRLMLPRCRRTSASQRVQNVCSGADIGKPCCEELEEIKQVREQGGKFGEFGVHLFGPVWRLGALICSV